MKKGEIAQSSGILVTKEFLDKFPGMLPHQVFFIAVIRTTYIDDDTAYINHPVTLIPTDLIIKRNNYREADTASITFPMKDPLFDPEIVKNIIVELIPVDKNIAKNFSYMINLSGYYKGIYAALDNIQPVFIGLGNNIDLTFNENGWVYNVDLTDYTSLLSAYIISQDVVKKLDVNRPLLSLITQLLILAGNTFIRVIENNNNTTTVTGLKVNVEDINDYFSLGVVHLIPKTSELYKRLVETPYKKINPKIKKKIISYKGKTYWDLIVDLVQSMGLLVRVVNDRIVIAEPQSLESIQYYSTPASIGTIHKQVSNADNNGDVATPQLTPRGMTTDTVITTKRGVDKTQRNIIKLKIDSPSTVYTGVDAYNDYIAGLKAGTIKKCYNGMADMISTSMLDRANKLINGQPAKKFYISIHDDLTVDFDATYRDWAGQTTLGMFVSKHSPLCSRIDVIEVITKNFLLKKGYIKVSKNNKYVVVTREVTPIDMVALFYVEIAAINAIEPTDILGGGIMPPLIDCNTTYTTKALQKIQKIICTERNKKPSTIITKEQVVAYTTPVAVGNRIINGKPLNFYHKIKKVTEKTPAKNTYTISVASDKLPDLQEKKVKVLNYPSFNVGENITSVKYSRDVGLSAAPQIKLLAYDTNQNIVYTATYPKSITQFNNDKNLPGNGDWDYNSAPGKAQNIIIPIPPVELLSEIQPFMVAMAKKYFESQMRKTVKVEIETNFTYLNCMNIANTFYLLPGGVFTHRNFTVASEKYIWLYYISDLSIEWSSEEGYRCTIGGLRYRRAEL